ncbi:MAG: glycoside hydrolase family 3 C-terminal domain-containing protein, partial [Candidatus Hydrogenedentes bacterium]|nr:glycoside hydrolase family 3 C-terminal domain-containing protein [Candidatus Hydrogenedentota bacterium]
MQKMTVDEKIGMLVGDGRFVPGFSPSTSDAGKGMIIENQRSKLVIPRLAIRTTVMSDGPAGLNRQPRQEGEKDYEYTIAFPTAMCLAATWNTGLVERVGEAFGNEALEYDYDLIFAPGLNIHRNPRDGRGFEYYSEDPLLSGKMAAAMVNGLQSNGIGATLKHFVAHNQQTNRRTYNAVISQRALREIYLRGFEIAVKESHPKAIMSSYNRLNGFYTAENSELLKVIVRDEWGFDGLHITDFDGLGSAVAKLRAGSNLLMSGNEQECNELKTSIKNKTFDETTLDENLFYCLKLKLESPRAQGYVPTSMPDLKAHAKIAREAAGEGIVLLKNENNCLPLKEKKTVAVFGKIAYDLIPCGTGSGMVRSTEYRVSVNEGLKGAGFTVLEDMEDTYEVYIEKIKRENLVPDYFNNPKMRKDNGIVDDQAPPHFKERLVAFSREAVLTQGEIKGYESRSDLAVITLGRSAGENYENGYLPITQIERELVRNVCDIFHAAGKQVVVVLNVGGVWETASWSHLPDAILLAWMPGQEGGNAIAKIINGNINPSGKLPDSIPVKYEDIPSADSFPGVPADDPINFFYQEGIYVGYRYYDSFNVATAYEFGYGLSYTTFAYSDLKLSSDTFLSSMEVSMEVENAGVVAGKEIVQVYLSAPTDAQEKPVQELVGFAKTKLLQPGERQRLSFTLDERSLSSFWSG